MRHNRRKARVFPVTPSLDTFVSPSVGTASVLSHVPQVWGNMGQSFFKPEKKKFNANFNRKKIIAVPVYSKIHGIQKF